METNNKESSQLNPTEEGVLNSQTLAEMLKSDSIEEATLALGILEKTPFQMTEEMKEVIFGVWEQYERLTKLLQEAKTDEQLDRAKSFQQSLEDVVFKNKQIFIEKRVEDVW